MVSEELQHRPNHHTYKLIRVHEDDPQRCVRNNKWGQCRFKRVSGEECCPIHHAGIFKLQKEKERTRKYLLNVAKTEYENYKHDTEILSLRDDIAILRVLISQRLAQCSDVHSLLLASPQISQLVAQVADTVDKCHKLEKSLGVYLDKVQFTQFCIDLVSVISTIVTDEEMMTEIGGAILDLTAQYGNN